MVQLMQAKKDGLKPKSILKKSLKALPMKKAFPEPVTLEEPKDVPKNITKEPAISPQEEPSVPEAPSIPDAPQEPATPKTSAKEPVIDESYIEMRCYIKYNLYYGQKMEDIKKALMKSGWKDFEIDKARKDLMNHVFKR